MTTNKKPAAPREVPGLEKPLEETILYDKPEHNIARITLNRPEKHNCIRVPSMKAYLGQLIDRAVNDDEVKVIILRGNGPSFCAGDDLNQAPVEAYGLRPGQRLSQMHRLRGFYKTYETSKNYFLYCPKNIIASVHGSVIGLGFDIALYSDLVIASENTKFSRAEQRLGFGGITSMLYILHLGPKRARELLLTGEQISIEKAMDWGLVNAVVPHEKLEEETLRWAKMICLHSADGLFTSKMLMQAVYESFGVGAANQAQMLAHVLFTNLVWQPDELNWLKLRNQVGPAEAFRQREAKWKELGF